MSSIKKYVSVDKLSFFFDNLKNVFVSKTEIENKADSNHNHDTSEIVSGTLNNDRLPVIPIAKGGTGATTAEAARANLGIDSAITSAIETAIGDSANADGVKIETGSYVGTGTYGADNPTTLTFGGKPKFVFIVYETTLKNNESTYRFEWFSGVTLVYVAASTSCTVKEIENGISLINGSAAERQMNIEGKVYTWFAIIG